MAEPFSARLGRKRKYPPGYLETPEFWAYRGAKQRCTDPNTEQYKDYGGRGIEFRFKDFNQFFAELGARPDAKLTLDRINNDGHYEPGNVRWATRRQQANNKRKAPPATLCKNGHPLSGNNLGISRGKNRISRRCLTCHREAERKRRQKGGVTPGRSAEYHRKWYAENREKALANRRLYRKRNLAKIAAYQRAYKARKKGGQ